MRLSNFLVASQQASAQRAARDLAQRILRASLDDLEALEDQEADVRYRLMYIRKMVRSSRSRCCSRPGARKKAPPISSTRHLVVQHRRKAG